jgi:Family of unknown function (DUF6335)
MRIAGAAAGEPVRSREAEMKSDEKFIEVETTERIDRVRRPYLDDFELPKIDVNAARQELRDRFLLNTSTSPDLSAGDIDACWDMAESSGEETAGGSAATPDQSVVGEIGEAIGITYEEDEQLKLGEKERERDLHRWELDPASSEDYRERMRELKVHRRAAVPFVRV